MPSLRLCCLALAMASASATTPEVEAAQRKAAAKVRAVSAKVVAKAAGRDNKEPPPEERRLAGGTCYQSVGVPVTGDCTCHSSCGDCGYYDMPTAPADCITCADSTVAVTQIYSDGTGTCGDSSMDALSACDEESTAYIACVFQNIQACASTTDDSTDDGDDGDDFTGTPTCAAFESNYQSQCDVVEGCSECGDAEKAFKQCIYKATIKSTLNLDCDSLECTGDSDAAAARHNTAPKLALALAAAAAALL